MKRILKCLLAALWIAAALALLTTAAAEPGKDGCPVSSEHDWKLEHVDSPTCDSTGTRYWHCDNCQKDTTETIPELGHDYLYETQAATCTETGYTRNRCTRCGNIFDQIDIPALGHDPEELPEKAATCTESGLTKGSKCKRCGWILNEQMTIQAPGHAWDGGTITTPATCKTAGVKTYVCIRCGATRTEEVPITDHTAASIPAVAATCTTGGKTEGSQCAICGVILTAQQDTPALGHAWDKDNGKYTEATCTAEGSLIYTCTRCGATWTETFPAHGHAWDSGTVTKERTCTTDGVLLFTCNNCGDTRTENFPATGHNLIPIPASAATCTKAGKTEGKLCTLCGTEVGKQQDIPALGHSWDGGTVTTAATCTTAGVRTYTCSRCGDDKTETIPATGHTAVTLPAVAATCTMGGKTEGSQCATCGAILTAQQDTPALGHSWDNGVTTTPSGFLEAGVKTYTCRRCGKTKTEEVPVQSTTNGHSIMNLIRNGHETGETFEEEDPLRIVTQPVGGMISRDGGSLELSVGVEGGKEPYTYEWRRRCYSLWIHPYHTIEGADGSTCKADLGKYTYYCLITDEAGNKVSSESVLVSYSLYIDQQPQNANLYGKDSVKLTCKAAGGSGDGYSYGWIGPGGTVMSNPITNEAGNVLTVSKPGTYSCWVMDNEGGEVYSETAIVYNVEPLTIEGLSDVMPLPGESAILAATVTGGVEPYTYEWEYTPDENASYMPDGSLLPDETDASITVPDDGRGWYRLTVTDSMGEEAYQWVRVKKYVEPLTIISTNFETEITDAAKGAAWSIEIAEGKQPYTYTLLREEETEDTRETWNTSETFAIKFAGWYAIHVEDAEGRVAETKYMEVRDVSVTIIDYTRSVSVKTPDGTAKISVTVTDGVEPYSYQWEKIGEDETFLKYYPPKHENILNEDQPWAEIGELNTRWKCTVTDSIGAKAVAYPMIVSCDMPLTIVEQPQSVTLYVDSDPTALPSATFTCLAVAPDNHPLLYQWQRRTSSGWANCTKFSSKNAVTLSEKRTDTFYYMLANAYRCIVKDTVTGEEVTSEEAKVLWPMKVTGRQDGKEGTIIVTIKGGKAPYSFSCYRRRVSFYTKGNGDMDVVQENFDLTNCSISNGTPHTGEYTFSRLSKHARKWYYDYDDLYHHYHYSHYSYYITVTDATGNSETIRVRMESNNPEFKTTCDGWGYLDFDYNSI